MISTLFLILQISLLLYFGWAAFYQFFFAVAGVFYHAPKVAKAASSYRRTVVFIPAYKEDAVILHTTQAALEQDYPADRFAVVVVADQLQPETLAALKEMPVAVVEVNFEKSTKSKALNEALRAVHKIGASMKHFKEAAADKGKVGSLLSFAERAYVFAAPQIAVVLDADNVMAPDFLKRVNQRFEQGAEVLQGRRAPKNFQSGLAMLDAASEDTNNHILCRGQRALGFSARLAGSGMAFNYQLFETAMAGIDVVGGFDKALEFHFTQSKISVQYDENALVYDEKVSAANAFARQRSRWIAAQFQFAAQHLPNVVPSVIRGRFDYANKSLQMALPPRLLLPGILAFGLIVNYLFGTDFVAFWALALAFNLGSFLIALPPYVFAFRNLMLWMELPAAFGATVLAMTKLKEAREKFIVTPKTVAVQVGNTPALRNRINN